MSIATPPIGSAVPVWLWQAFPSGVQTWLSNRPALMEWVWATGQSGSFGVSILVVAAAQAGAFATASSTLSWVGDHWWGLVMAAVISIYRGNAAHSKAAATAAKGP